MPEDKNASRSTSIVRWRKSSEAERILSISASPRPKIRNVSMPRRRSRKCPLKRARARKLRRLASAAPIPTSAINNGISGAVPSRMSAAAQLEGEDSHHNQQRHRHCQRHLRQVACIVIMHIVNLLEYQRRPAPRWFTLNPRWPCLLQTVENLTADGKADMLPWRDNPPVRVTRPPMRAVQRSETVT